MEIETSKFKGHHCFKDDWVGFDSIEPINIIIGRNNTGKSNLIDLIEHFCSATELESEVQFEYTGTLQEEELRQHFSQHINGSGLEGNHWIHHGASLVNNPIVWRTNNKGDTTYIRTTNSDIIKPENKSQPYSEYYSRISRLTKSAKHPLNNKQFRRILADRDITPETASTITTLLPNGNGATNLIRKFITSSDEQNFPREIIQRELLEALNQIFGTDGEFNEITIQQHDDKQGRDQNAWEVYLGEESKGIVPLSKSGSGLKTILLVLLNLIAIPTLEKREKNEYVFAFEELENNLHPALLRRLFQYIENYAAENKSHFFITTHSSIALDFFGVSENAQITHVKHNGHSATTAPIKAHFDKVSIVSELGAKPSDILQANGIIWVEGPSDRIYLNRWIELISEGEFQEGRDYQCAFYGGALLAKTEFTSPDEESREKNRVNLISVNSNNFVICDGDRQQPESRLKDRVRRISAEVKKIPNAGFWATGAREIENYVPGEAIAAAMNRKSVASPNQYQSFFPKSSSKSDNFIETELNRKTLDKTQFAIDCIKYMTLENMSPRFDWLEQMQAVVKAIKSWNA